MNREINGHTILTGLLGSACLPQHFTADAQRSLSATGIKLYLSRI